VPTAFQTLNFSGRGRKEVSSFGVEVVVVVVGAAATWAATPADAAPPPLAARLAAARGGAAAAAASIDAMAVLAAALEWRGAGRAQRMRGRSVPTAPIVFRVRRAQRERLVRVFVFTEELVLVLLMLLLCT
jgi:hypothetical protein